ncbi:MAG TPA: protein kinase [Pirellulales bacterium]|nr:protein kinase [Pirellulales bacterium]
MTAEFDNRTRPDDAVGASCADDCTDDPRVARALHEYVAAIESGDPPDRDEFLAKHADISSALAACLDSLAIVLAAAPRLRLNPGDHATPSSPVAMPAALGDFRIIRELGRGGMGVVYEAEQLSLGRRVALKVLPFASALDVTRLQRFKNEAQAAAQLHHTNIVPVYAVGCERGVHFYAMQLIEGETLGSLILGMAREARGLQRGAHRSAGSPTEDWVIVKGEPAANPGGKRAAVSADLATPHHDTLRAGETAPLTGLRSAEQKTKRLAFYQTAARLGVQAAEALEHAHQMGVIHRDVKPGNLLLDARGKLWITDFGLAQFQAEGGLTLTGNLPGTIRYMSPEQATGKRVLLDHRTDIYSLGITLYELLTLEPAFDDSDGRVLLRQIAIAEPRTPRAVDPNIPLDLETILLKATAKLPVERYATAQALADDLQRFLDHQPISARRPSALDRVVKWGRRHKPIVVAGVLSLVLVSLGLLASTILIAREHAKTKVAYQRVVEERAAANQSFQQARQAVDAFTQLSEEELTSKPSMLQSRRKFLETALDYYETFLEQHRNDKAVQAELAATRQWVAKIIDELTTLSSFGPLVLLSDERVQEELGIGNSQREEIEKLIDKLWAQQAETNDQQLTREQRQHLLAESLRLHEEQIARVIGPRQMERLRQIALQQQGPFAFKRQEVIEALDLSSDQRQRITDIIEAHAPHRRQFRDRPFPEDGPPDWHAAPPPKPYDDMFEPHDRRPPRSEPSSSEIVQDDGHVAFEQHTARENEADPPGSGHRRGSFDGPPRSDRRPPPPHDDHHGPHRGPPGPRELTDTMRRTVDDIVTILTPEQRHTWSALVGEPVQFKLHHSPENLFLW